MISYTLSLSCLKDNLKIVPYLENSLSILQYELYTYVHSKIFSVTTAQLGFITADQVWKDYPRR
jgi:hypothetical protein